MIAWWVCVIACFACGWLGYILAMVMVASAERWHRGE